MDFVAPVDRQTSVRVDDAARGSVSAGLDSNYTRYFEAHGSETTAGDFIEARAIASTLKCQRPRNEVVNVDALKINIGHLEGASGVASAI